MFVFLLGRSQTDVQPSIMFDLKGWKSTQSIQQLKNNERAGELRCLRENGWWKF